MAQKSNIRSIRFSDELADLIDRQAGRNFTEKLENLITRCVWELPEREKELERINKEIEKRRHLLQELQKDYLKLLDTVSGIQYETRELEKVINEKLAIWKA